MKRMLINATQQEELRVAMVDGQKLYDLDIEVPAKEQKKSNIYKSKITRIEPSLEAVFVDYGSERHGFLPFKEITRNYFDSTTTDDKGRPQIKDALKIGQNLLIQVDKEERGNKGAALTTKISLAGRFLVLMPTDARAGGVSRRIEGDDRSEVRDALTQLDIVDGMGVIVRTAGVGRSVEELQWDLDYLCHLWGIIEKANEDRDAPCLIYQESNVIIRALRDHYRGDIGEIYIDEESIYQQAHNFIKQIMPKDLRKLKKYSDAIPLFNRFQIESQIETAFNREVTLPSGGAIVIDHTEALTSIDINSGRATKGSDIEETALQTNIEAADEIARQLRLRDLGGLIVIDFIDMLANKNQRAVEERLRQALRIDRARVQISRISRFGLLEMSRQRLRPSLGESSLVVCPRCTGHGSIRSIESLALAVLRLVEEEAMKDNTSRVIAQVPVDVATFLLNEKRDIVLDVESRNNVDTLILPNPNLETPHFSVERIRIADANESGNKFSYEQIADDAEQYIPSPKKHQKVEEPAVKNIIPDKAIPRIKPKKPGLLKRLLSALFGSNSGKKNKKQHTNQAKNKSQQSRNNPKQRNQRGRNTGRAQQNKQQGTRKNQDYRQRNTSPSNGRNTTQKDKPNRQEKQNADSPKRSKAGGNARRNDKKQHNSPRYDKDKADGRKNNTSNHKPSNNSQQKTQNQNNRQNKPPTDNILSNQKTEATNHLRKADAEPMLHQGKDYSDLLKGPGKRENEPQSPGNDHTNDTSVSKLSTHKADNHSNHFERNSESSVSSVHAATTQKNIPDDKPISAAEKPENKPAASQQTNFTSQESETANTILHQYPPNALRSPPFSNASSNEKSKASTENKTDSNETEADKPSFKNDSPDPS